MRSSSRPDGVSDTGLSFIEILVAVVLIGTATMGILPLLWSSVHGSALQDRFAGARRWLVSAGDYAASDALGPKSCDTATIVTDYQQDLRDAVKNNRPAGPWTNSQLTVTKVWFWNGMTFGPTCVPTMKLQQISIMVVSLDGVVAETLDVVKDVASNV